MIEVELPDGTIVEFPEGTPQDVMRDALRRQFGGQQSSAPQPAQPQPSAAPQPSQGVSTQQRYDEALARVRQKQFPDMSDQQWAEYSRTALGPYSGTDLATHGIGFGLTDEIASGVGALGSGLRNMITGQGQGFGEAFGTYQDLETARRDLGREQMGGAGLAAEIIPAVLTGGAAFQGAKMAPTLAGRAMQGATQGGLMGAAYGAGSTDGNLQDRATGAAIGGTVGGVVGAATPYVGNAVAERGRRAAQGRAINQATRSAPTSQELKTTASRLFESSKDNSFGIVPQSFDDFADRITRKAVDFGVDRQVHPDTWAVLSRIDGTKGRMVGLKEMHTLRQVAQGASRTTKPADAEMARRIVDEIDDFIGQLKPTDVIGADPRGKANDLLRGISTWGRAKRMDIIEEAIYKAQNQASGVENGLRVQFRQLLQNPKTRKLFSAAERQAIEDVVRGDTATNLMKLLGKFGFGSGNASNMMGGTVGGLLGGSVLAGGNPIGGIALSAAGTAARKGAEKMTERAAERALRTVGTDGIRSLPAISQATPTLAESLLQQGRQGLPQFMDRAY